MSGIICSLLITISFLLLPVSSKTKTHFGKQLKSNEAENEVLWATNAQRAKKNLNSLTINSVLCEVARRYAKNLADKNVLTHDLGGESVGKRLHRAGYQYQRYGENLAAGRISGTKAVELLMGSPSHKKNIMNKDFTEIGIGVYKSRNGEIFYCQIFGKPLTTK